MIFNNPYWSNRTKIELLQRWILVHSYIYYEKDTNAVADDMFDKNCEQLRIFMSKYKRSAKESRYYKIFKDFNGYSGFNLVSEDKIAGNKEIFDLIKSDCKNILKKS